MSRSSRRFSAVRTDGGLLPQDILSRIQSGDSTLPGTRADTYNLGPHERIGEAVNRSWNQLIATWRVFRKNLEKEPEHSPASGLTRDRWLLPLFKELEYGRLPRGRAIKTEGRSFSISHTWHNSPIHLLGCRVDLDRRQKGVAGAAQSSPHGLVQAFLNQSDKHLWGFVANGYRLRLLRDHHSLTRQAYVEFDLQAIMDGEQYSEFLLLWLICHQSRVEAEKSEDCWLETWFGISQDEGVRALDKLRGGVEKAIESLGTGFLNHQANTRLKEALQSGALDKQEYYRQILRLAYRLIFLFAAEEREALLNPNAPEEARERYRRYYAAGRLRELADKRRGGPHGDLWQGLALIMNKLNNGYKDLALPALGSLLWNPEACSYLMDAECANEHVLSAVRSLSHIQEGSTRLPVNWRNVGADELGSVYESLLELHPHIGFGNFKLATEAGHERKTTGSYYTSATLVDCLLDTTLNPMLDEACRKPNAEEAILNLKICDPACGSGCFLVAAARRIARRLAAVRLGDDEPSPSDVQTALRDVVGRCIFGVDLNPMAVELCKVSLWMEALEPGKPLSFLDSHIQCGNALLGATPALMAGGIPDGAFDAIEGDDRKAAQALKKQNRSERKDLEAGQKTMLADFDEAAEAALVSKRAADIEDAPDNRIKSLRVKEKSWKALTESHEFRDAWFRADAWTSTFFAVKQTGGAPVITENLWNRLSRDAVPQAIRNSVCELAEEYRFFHWQLAFPAVFPAGKSGPEVGFDAVIGNPPWDKLKPYTQEFFSEYNPDIRFQDLAGERRMMADLLEDDATAAKWARYRRNIYAQALFIKKSGRYDKRGVGDINLYQAFIEVALTITRGRASQLVPAGFYNGVHCKPLRKDLFENHQLESIYGFDNPGGIWFEGIDSRFKFAIYSVIRFGRTRSFKTAFNIRSRPRLSSVMAGNCLSMPLSLVHDLSPENLDILEFESPKDIEIAKKLYARWPRLGSEEAGGPRHHQLCEIHMGNDRELFSENPDGLPLYQGRMLGQYDHCYKGYRSGRGRATIWEKLDFGSKSIQPQWRVLKKNIPARLGERPFSYRAGYHDIANPTDERSFIAALLPNACIAGHTVPTIVFAEDWALIPWLATANSFTMDFLVRKKIGLHVTFTVLNSLPFPRYKVEDSILARLAPLVLRLSCTTPEMNAYWNAMASYGWVQPIGPNSEPPGLSRGEERLNARAAIDAIVARDIYGLSEEELFYLLDAFPLVRRRDEEKYGEYRTKKLILEAYRGQE